MSIAMNDAITAALKEFLYKVADDLLILGHRNSEWTGLGPVLEEDIAFSSMAQDKLGQALALYEILHALGENDPDTVAFMRNDHQFHNCTLVELPIGEYDFSLVRHFLFDQAIHARFLSLQESEYEPLQQLARKFSGENKYHVLHANTWILNLARDANARERLQNSLNECFPLALGVFEEGPSEELLIQSKIFKGEKALREEWLQLITPVLEKAGLQVPTQYDEMLGLGGRYGKHTAHLQPLLDEMSEVFKIDPTAEW